MSETSRRNFLKSLTGIPIVAVLGQGFMAAEEAPIGTVIGHIQGRYRANQGDWETFDIPIIGTGAVEPTLEIDYIQAWVGKENSFL